MPREGYYLPERRLVSQDDAAMIENANVPRSKFTGSWTRKTAFNAAQLVPILVEEVLPGDHLSYNVTAYVRMATPLFPLFDNQRIDTFFFYVPNRILWDNWVRFMGEQDTPASSIAFTIPQIVSAAGGFAVASIYDHMGLPTVGQTTGANTLSINALPLRAYNRIWNDWFRDQNITNKVPVSVTDGPDAAGNYNVLVRAKSHDYFTSALPWPQKFIAPTVPLGGLAPVQGIGTLTSADDGAQIDVIETFRVLPDYALHQKTTTAGRGTIEMIGGRPAIYADLGQATGVAINTFRQAFLIQQLLERDARGGTRYVELLRSHFGVTNPDFRLQRPEYIGGGQSPLVLTPVAQTAPSAGVPVGALGAAGTSVGQHRASFAATEHGYIIGLINVRSELSYQQGIHKQWSRLTRYDFYWPSLAGLGEQAILRKEIYATGVPANDDVVFGYQERWHEYRTRTSEVTGILRSTAASTLDMWHLAQNFTSAPTLSDAFIYETPPMARILAAGAAASGQQYLADILIERTAVRPIPTYGTPVTLGRF